MTLRRLGPEDWVLFREIRLEMLLREPSAFASTHAEWAAKPEAEIRDWLRQIHLFAGLAEGRAVATAAWHPMPSAAQPDRAEIIAVYTRSESRGQGWLRQLLIAIEDDVRAAGIETLQLELAKSNTGAHAAYARLGFTVKTVPPDQMRGANSFVMGKAVAG